MTSKTENKYERAAATWVARYLKVDPKIISNVNFAVAYGGYCETCGYETAGLEFKKNGKWETIEIPDYVITPGEFIEECVAILKEEE